MMSTNLIARDNVEDILPLTSIQKGMLFQQLMSPDTSEYFVQLHIKLEGSIFLETFINAWNLIIKNNEMLRTFFRWDKIEEPIQIILKEHQLNFITFDLSGENKENQDKRLKEIISDDKMKKFNLTEVPFRITLIKLTENNYSLLISNHHIIYDGWSTAILIEEFLNHYSSMFMGNEPNIRIKSKFREFVKTEYSSVIDDVFWSNYLLDIESYPLLNGSWDKQRDEKDFRTYETIGTRELSQQVINKAREQRVSQSSIFFLAWGITLQKYLDHNDIVFGITLSQRNESIPGIMESIGLYINTLPLRLKFSCEDMVNDQLQTVNNNVTELSRQRNTSLVDLNNYVNSKDALFDTLVVVENYPINKAMIKKNEFLDITGYMVDEHTNYPLSMAITLNDVFQVNFTYDTSLYSEEVVKNLATHFMTCIKELVNSNFVSTKISDISIIDAVEESSILDLNKKTVSYEDFKPIHYLIEDQTSLTPNNIAVKFKNMELTYKELNGKANDLSRILIKNGVTNGQFVPIYIDHSLELVIAIFAVMKIGAVFVPIDTKWPKNRISDIYKQLGEVKVTLTSIVEADQLGLPTKLIKILTDQLNIIPNNPSINVQLDDPIYCIFTSGSTGKPKGVIIPHQGITNRFYWMNEYFESNTVVPVTLQTTRYVYDSAVWQLYWPLICGGKTVILPSDFEFLPDNVLKIIDENDVNVIDFVPSVFNTFVDNLQFGADLKSQLKSIRHIIVGGEEANISPIRKIMEELPTIKFTNLYGPTEASIGCVFYQIKDSELNKIPIGKPINNMDVYILDGNQKLMPIGQKGEIYISGVGLGIGYVNDPDNTKKAFVKKSFGYRGLLYKTGDLGRWLPNGELEYLGRIDNQIKKSGHRIELSEIDSVLLKFSDATNIVTIVTEDKQIITFYHSKDKSIDLKSIAIRKLPRYMVSNHYVHIEKFPLTLSGKVDKNQLLTYFHQENKTNQIVEPSSEYEIELSKIWGRIFNTEKMIGVDEDFFDLGGHSLLIMSLRSEILKRFNVSILLSSLFDISTIKGQGEIIKEKLKDKTLNTSNKLQTNTLDHYPLSSAQNRMYILHQMYVDSTVNNMSGIVRLSKNVSQDRIEFAFNSLISRHDILRTAFMNDEGQIIQKVFPKVSFSLELFDSRIQPLRDIYLEFIKPFELEKPCQFRAALISTDEDHSILLVDIHHIISDGMSVEIMIKELELLYYNRSIPEPRYQYSDFIKWQQEKNKNQGFLEHEKYWIDTLNENIPVLQLPTDFPRPAIKKNIGDRYDCWISDTEIISNLYFLSRKTNTTVFITLLTAFYVLLQKYSGQNNLIVGTPVSGRINSEFNDTVGLFMNVVPLKCTIDSTKTFEELAIEVKELFLGALEYQDYPIESLIKKVILERDLSRNPLYDAMFSYESSLESEKSDIFGDYTYINKSTSKLDLTLLVEEKKDGLLFSIEYDTTLFKEKTITRMMGHYLTIIDQIIANSKINLEDIAIVTEQERYELLFGFNSEKRISQPFHSIVSLIEKYAKSRLNDKAIYFGSEYYTYKEILESVNKISAALKEKGISKGDVVALLLNRSLELIPLILALLKVGAAYLPIDNNTPKERIRYMLEDSKATLLITDQKDSYNITIVSLSELSNSSTSQGNGLDLVYNYPGDLAYLIYTSGSTGKPKGVEIEHRSLTNLIYAINEKIPFERRNKIICLTTVSFDIFVLETLIPLANGMQVILANENDINDPKRTVSLMENHSVDSIQSTPSRMGILIKQMNRKVLDNLKIVLIGGEQFPLNLLTELKEKTNARIFNMYGPTETTVWSTVGELTDSTNIHIGKPISNTQIFILDHKKRPLPVGVIGELYIGGDGIARGYTNKKLTDDRFVDDPFFNNKMYQTGDLARWMPDGTIELFGRIDHQVKVRGYRIELEEVERVIASYNPSLETAVVKKKGNSKEDVLCAYFRSDINLTTEELMNYCQHYLPYYMIPNYFIRLDHIPLNVNGKIDRKLLSEIELSEREEISSIEPQNEIQKNLIDLWKKAMSIDYEININTDFFVIGGHSLSLITLSHYITEAYDVEIPIVDLFRYSTIEQQASLIERSKQNVNYMVEPVRKKEAYPLTAEQSRMFILSNINENDTSYNVPVNLHFTGDLDVDKLVSTIQEIVNRHDSLRTYIDYVDGQFLQKVIENMEITIERIGASEEEVHKIIKNFVRPFDVTKPPLIRACLIEINHESYILVMDMHHIITDGTSISILAEEFYNLYNGEELKELTLQYKDYAVWQQDERNKLAFLKAETYWTKHISNRNSKKVSLPADIIEVHNEDDNLGKVLQTSLSPVLVSKIRGIAQNSKTTINAIMLTAYKILLHGYTKEKDIVIGVPLSCRENGLDRVVGNFVNTMPFRTELNPTNTASELLNQVSKTMLEAITNRNYQLDWLIAKLNLQGNYQSNPLFDTVFIYQYRKELLKLADLEVELCPWRELQVQFDIQFAIEESLESIILSIEYSTSKYSKDAIHKFAENYIDILQQITIDPDQMVNNIVCHFNI
ncbi:amino acid adenylation domain-containing protein [Paenibacillus amylolyticus]|uniref:Amino acid adenylation domain-containing protein n=2 Tax=Paenibacillus amylolyticus TaxID=1451 RepID=A0A5M9WU42_PAEAM|nr:amino acid adenylation domain-containing protein [Paenibacillus amylolyticus]